MNAPGRPAGAYLPGPHAGAPLGAGDFTGHLRTLFYRVCDDLLARLGAGEQATINLEAEQTLFVRFNANRVRQNTDVQQMVLSLRLQSQGRTVEKSRTLSGVVDADRSAVAGLLDACRREVAVLPIDPHQVPVANHGSSDEDFHGHLLQAHEVVQAVVGPAAGCDLAGLYAGGTVVRANRNSAGQRHWFATESFFLDYSLYNGPKAAKGGYAGSHWDGAAWTANLEHTRALLALLERPVQPVPPGSYRTYLAPRAFADLVGILGWNALSAAAWKQGRSPFKKLAEREVRLSPLLHISENFGLGLAPRFNSLGEVSAPSLALVQDGELANLLVSARTAKEYGLVANGASEGEAPRALDVRTGVLRQEDVLRELGTGLYLSNLHYLNWSDPVSARVTGMTRYACFWVQDGAIAGPIHDLRWDESLYDALGAKLLALTSHAEIDPEVDTYYQRALGGSRVPGALIDGFTFTL